MNFYLATVLMLTYQFFIRNVDAIYQPHIVIIYADDLGWNDVSFHGSPQIPTPNIDALAMNGILLNNYYAQWLCTPSRGSLFTGQYPIRFGLQHSVIEAGEQTALPLNFTTLPQHLKKLGYKTHMVGKWHLGYHKKEYTPNHRGFDSFIGYLNGAIDYYDYTYDSRWYPLNNWTYFGVDLYDGDTLLKNFRNQYATAFFAEKARDVIKSHDTEKPLFLFVSQIAVHASASNQHLQAPPEVVRNFKYISDKNRRIFAGVMSVLDDTVGMVFKALEEKNMLQDTLVLFLSDNGGENRIIIGGYGSNFPLRGSKYTLWEGGLRVPAVVWGHMLNLQKSRISNQFIHVTDWLPTLYRAAGGNPMDLGTIDGHDMWDVLTENLPSPRKDLLYNIDPISGTSAYRIGDLKVINGTSVYDPPGSLFETTGFEDIGSPPSMEQWVFKKGSSVRDVLIRNGLWIAENPDEWYKHSKITCPYPPPESAKLCNPDVKPCLFNIAEDPCEYFDLAPVLPEIARSLMEVIQDFQKVAMMPQSKDVDRIADPMCHNFSYVPWLDPEHLTECDYLS